jgi:hypothetical protein
MKEFVISVFAALVLSCIFSSIGIMLGQEANFPPYPVPAGIKEVKSSAPHFGCKRDENSIPEIDYTNGARPTFFITDVTDKGDRSNAEFPLGANN